LAARRIKAVIPPNPTRKHPPLYDKTAYKAATSSSGCFSVSKTSAGSQPDTTSADIFLSAILLVAAITWWTN